MAFTLFALFAGALSHPPGSLIFPRGSRMWRFSPFPCFIESIVVFIRLFHFVLSNRKSQADLQSMARSKATALLAERIGNSLGTWEDCNVYCGTPTKKDIDVLFTEVSKIDMSKKLHFCMGIQILFQFVKLCAFKGAVFSRFAGFAFFLNWLAIELLLVLARPDKELKAEERRLATELLLFSCIQPHFPWTSDRRFDYPEYLRMIDINNMLMVAKYGKIIKRLDNIFLEDNHEEVTEDNERLSMDVFKRHIEPYVTNASENCSMIGVYRNMLELLLHFWLCYMVFPQNYNRLFALYAVFIWEMITDLLVLVGLSRYLTRIYEPIVTIVPIFFSLKTFLYGLTWYIFRFNGIGTYKPKWTDWLG